MINAKKKKRKSRVEIFLSPLACNGSNTGRDTEGELKV